ncbi:MAG: lyase family protein [Christensenellaceae bacterium]
MSIRLESDSVGSLPIPSDAYYGIQSLRAKENFPISGRAMHPAFLHSLTQIKLAAARANARTGQLPPPIVDAICAACGEVLSGGFADQFPVDAIQGGAGTSANMNVNEVLANRAIELLGGQRGNYHIVHPNDHVNMSQSTNDTIPSAGKLTVLALLPALCGELESLADALLEKATAFDGILRIGRTQLQDAVPMRLGQGFHAYAGAIRRDIARLLNPATQCGGEV